MRPVLTVLAAVLYAAGWAAGAVSLLVAWALTALAVGWDDARALPTRRDADRERVGAP